MHLPTKTLVLNEKKMMNQLLSNETLGMNFTKYANVNNIRYVLTDMLRLTIKDLELKMFLPKLLGVRLKIFLWVILHTCTY
jgi:hypothetical protein